MHFEKHFTIYTLKKEWKRIYSLNNLIKPTQSYSYYKVLFHSFYLHIKEHIRRRIIFHYFKSNDDECIIPLVVYVKKNTLTGISNYQRLDYEDIISSTNNISFLNNCFNRIAIEYPNYHINIENINQDSLYFALFGAKMKPYETCVSIDIRNNYESYISSISKHQRQNIRTAYNKLSKKNFQIRLERFDKNHPIPKRLWKECLKIYDERHHVPTTGFNWLRHQLNAFTHILKKAEGWQIYVLFHHNIPLAYMAGLCSEKQHCYYIPRLCINNQYREYSPGIILLVETIKEQQKKNIQHIDLMRGDEPYKAAMGGKNHYNFQLTCDTEHLINNHAHTDSATY